MEKKETEIDLTKLFKILWNSKYKLIKCGVIGSIIGVIIAFSIPRMYTTTVKIAPEGGESSSSMGGMSALAGFAGINLGDEVVGITPMIYPDVIRSSPFLLEFVNVQVENNGKQIAFYQYITEEQKKAWWGYIISAPMQLLGLVMELFIEVEEEEGEIDIFKPSLKQNRYINYLRNNISVTSDKKTNVFTISVNMQNPKTAAVITDSLMNKLQFYMTEYKTSKIKKDLLVKQKMLQDARSNYYITEESLAEELDNNRNIITQRGQVKINRLTNEKNLAFTIYQQLATQVASSKVKLQDEIPIATIIEPSSVAIKASVPNKPFTVIIFAFLGAISMSVVILYKSGIFNPNQLD